MSIDGWRYYNHALIPTCAPHETPNIEALKDPAIWSGSTWGGWPLLARWTTDWDCDHETNWWYVIKDTPVSLEELSSHSRKHIRQGLKKCNVCKIDSRVYAEELYECSHAAFQKYENASNESSREQFIRSAENGTASVYWGGFEKESGKLIGYLIVKANLDFAEIVTAKFDPQYLYTHVSDALYYTAINEYLLNGEMKYVSSGQRNIIHVTNTQEYKEQTLGYRKAYCKLHIKYRFPLGFAIKVLYPFRHWLEKLDKKKYVHLVIGILKMEEIVRER